ncbi:A/G-specific adenine glycosylase [Persicimonas caeni]|uniref:A/G-specific adenine glycosylase n=1 Tax=Persicimonas caeni TaxID=2292766 RepID=A0A4Y6PVS2_PERCE|nr:A/G-specific adenine glycosylase [Persicimonas caeni]QDG52097.1 A/G-specific adenine glycosylase [Persicimonas caeni]QED33318.1 A/G-specific adenine glycosylase [Persicimonas caeni]
MSYPDAQETPEEKWAYLRKGIIEWWSPEDHDFPWRKPDDEWKLLVTEILLQRTRASAVAQLYDDFFERFPTPESLAEASTEEVGDAIYSLGLAWRAKYISQLGDQLAELTGEVPDTRDGLKELPGVGPYVSGAFQVLHRNQPDSFVDSNVVRLLGRYFGFEWDGETRRRKWFLQFVDRLFEHEYEPSRFGYALLDFTREVCAPSPNCEVCPVRERCHFAAEHKQARI